MQYRTSSYAEDVFDYFYFEKNLQGDIVSVYNVNGTKLVSYSYDAWGNHTAHYTTVAALPEHSIILSVIVDITMILIWDSTISTTVTTTPLPADFSLPTTPLISEQTKTC